MKQMLKLVELLHKPTSIQESKQNIYLRANLGTHRRWFLVDFFSFEVFGQVFICLILVLQVGFGISIQQTARINVHQSTIRKCMIGPHDLLIYRLIRWGFESISRAS